MKSKWLLAGGLSLTIMALALVFVVSGKGNRGETPLEPADEGNSTQAKKIADIIQPGESLYRIFKRHNLDLAEMDSIRNVARKVYALGRLVAGRPYSLSLSEEMAIEGLTYEIDDDSYLSVTKTPEGYLAEKLDYDYERRTARMGGVIENNLISAMGGTAMAIAFADIFAWQVDFNTDLRKGDVFRVIVEELWLDGVFRRYGKILSAELLNEGKSHKAYFFELKGLSGYYDGEGKSMRRAFLKAPLSFSRISSGFSGRRFHPVLKIVRPHFGVDYAAARGTPVSAPADGTVEFAGHKGANGNLVVLRHPNGYKSYYGHLSGFGKKIKAGTRVTQGQVIGYVGSTGLATGPHLDYRVKLNGVHINPLKLKSPPATRIPGSLMADFRALVADMDGSLASITSASQAPARADL